MFGWVPATIEVIPADGGTGLDRALFAATLTWSSPSSTGRRDGRLAVEYLGDREVAAAIRVRVDLPAGQPWWLVPGAFYGENRPVGCARIFPRFAVGADDPDGMVSDH